jgi:2'-5' RNA ligase
MGSADLRIFIAVDPSAEAVHDLALLVKRLRVVTRNVRPEQWHVTLAFLGDIEPETLPVVEQAVADAALASRPGQLRVGGGGRFGTSVLWAGLRGDVDTLRELAEGLRTSLKAAGLGFDERPYRPHVTIARPGPGASLTQLRADLELLSRYRGPYWPLEHVYVVRSHFPAPVRHERLGSWPLGGAEAGPTNGRRQR